MKLRLKHAAIIVLAIACVTAILISVSQDRIGLSELGYVTKLKISIVYDNEALNKSLEASWGFACIVELKDESILFDTGGDGDPASPIIISNPEPGHKYEIKVVNLINGQTYCVQIVTEDSSGQKSISLRKTITPQETFTLTEMEGEEGGLDCLGSVNQGRAIEPTERLSGEMGAELALLFLPLFVLMGWKIRLRRKK